MKYIFITIILASICWPLSAHSELNETKEKTIYFQNYASEARLGQILIKALKKDLGERRPSLKIQSDSVDADITLNVFLENKTAERIKDEYFAVVITYTYPEIAHILAELSEVTKKLKLVSEALFKLAQLLQKTQPLKSVKIYFLDDFDEVRVADFAQKAIQDFLTKEFPK